MQHVHISFLHAVVFWLYVLIGGTFVRLISAYLQTLNVPLLQTAGRVIAYQY